MKILQVCSAQSLGGGERHVIDLTRALIERGHELHVAVRKNNALRDELKNLQIHWHEIPLRNALDIFSARALAKIIRAEKIEILHAHLARDYTICGLAAKLTPVKFFLTRHHFNPLKTNFLYRWAMNRTTKFIAVSNSVATMLQQAFPALKHRVEVVPNWIDLKNIGSFSKADARAVLGIKNNFAVGVIGQITRLKGQDIFLQAAELFGQGTAPEMLPSFVIVGDMQTDADPLFAQELREIANQSSVRAQISFTGFVPDITAKLAAFEIVVIPSQNEGFSLVAIEAMAAGCAVVASNVGALTELIEPEKTGLLFPPGDSPALAHSLARLVQDQTLHTRLSQTAQVFAHQNFAREEIISRIEKLYQHPHEKPQQIRRGDA